jgi:hypothetical protein
MKHSQAGAEEREKNAKGNVFVKVAGLRCNPLELYNLL